MVQFVDKNIAKEIKLSSFGFAAELLVLAHSFVTTLLVLSQLCEAEGNIDDWMKNYELPETGEIPAFLFRNFRNMQEAEIDAIQQELDESLRHT